MGKPMKSDRLRTLIKSLGWECFSFLLALIVSYFFIGCMVKATELSVLMLVMKVSLLYLYDRLWDRIQWGLINDDV